MDGGKACFVAAVAQIDVADGWRDQRGVGGWVIDIGCREIVALGISLPHLRRFYRDTLWLHNSGTGQLGTFDLQNGKFEPVTFTSGYLRGFSFHGDYAVIGLSKSRDNKTFAGLPL